MGTLRFTNWEPSSS